MKTFLISIACFLLSCAVAAPSETEEHKPPKHGDTLFTMKHAPTEKEQMLLGTNGARDVFVSEKCKTCRKVASYIKGELDDADLRSPKEVADFLSRVCDDMAEWHGTKVVDFCRKYIGHKDYVDNIKMMVVASPRVSCRASSNPAASACLKFIPSHAHANMLQAGWCSYQVVARLPPAPFTHMCIALCIALCIAVCVAACVPPACAELMHSTRTSWKQFATYTSSSAPWEAFTKSSRRLAGER